MGNPTNVKLPLLLRDVGMPQLLFVNNYRFIAYYISSVCQTVQCL